MIAEKTEVTPMAGHKHHIVFFRQSGWMMIATTLGGGLMYAVHMVAGRMPAEEYGVFTTLIQIVGLMSIPAVGLQGIFTQQAAASLNPEHERELAGVFRGVLRGTFFIWLLMAVLAGLLHRRIINGLGITNPAALAITVGVALLMLWRPIVLGVLQGRQNFLWLGWTAILEGIGRIAAVIVIVGLLGGYAAGAMTAVLLGSVLVTVLGGWFSRDCFQGEAVRMKWKGWLARVVPLTLGIGVGTFMLSADMIFVQNFFSKEQTGYYAAAGMIGRALVYFTAPLTAVMFPKIVRSSALGEKSHALILALGVTALAGGAAALACTFLPSLPLRIVYPPNYVAVATPLVPLFAWCMLPLTLSNVLINSLMARSRFAAVPWLVAVAVAYAVTLYFKHDSFQAVIRTLGLFGVLLLGVCAWFSFHDPRPKPGDSRSTPPV